jgi:hypothetical protein
VREKYRDPSLTEMRTLRTVPLSVLAVPAGLWQDATSAEPEDGIDGNPVAQRSAARRSAAQQLFGFPPSLVRVF